MQRALASNTVSSTKQSVAAATHWSAMGPSTCFEQRCLLSALHFFILCSSRSLDFFIFFIAAFFSSTLAFSSCIFRSQSSFKTEQSLPRNSVFVQLQRAKPRFSKHTPPFLHKSAVHADTGADSLSLWGRATWAHFP